MLIKRALPKLAGRKGKVTGVLDIPEEYWGQEVTLMMVNDAMELDYSQEVTLM